MLDVRELAEAGGVTSYMRSPSTARSWRQTFSAVRVPRGMPVRVAVSNGRGRAESVWHLFTLSRQEVAALISQNATSKGRGGRRKLPIAFTEHGAIMAANVLNSGRAIEVSVYVVRAFVRLREATLANKEVAARLAELERRVTGHDEAIRSLVQTIRQLMAPPEKPRRSIGFRVEEGGPAYRRRRRQRSNAERA